ncbi:MAG: ABC transporter permease subunit [Bacteroidota bacterium]
MSFYRINKNLEGRQRWLLELGGFALILGVWWMLTAGSSPVVEKGILPAPRAIFKAFGELINQNDLIPNFCYSLGLNLGGYMEAILLSIPLGFLMGLVPQVRAAFIRPVDAARFLVLPAAVGLFIAWFGIGSWMKVHFLAFGIIIYLLPVAIQRVDDVHDVYLKTVYTLGASRWQMIQTVYFPSVISKLFTDIRILTAISWTYIVIAEAIGGEAGIGALTWRVGLRRGRIDKVFCLLIIIMIVGIIQDKLFGYLDRKLFPHKYQAVREEWEDPQETSVSDTIMDYMMSTFSWVLIGAYLVLLLDEYFSIIGNVKLLSYLFKDTIWVFHLIFIGLVAIKIRPWIGRFSDSRQSIPTTVS